MKKKRRIVITGLGMVTPLGLSTKETWEAILAGKSGIAPIDFSAPDSLFKSFEPDKFPCQFSASVKGFEGSNYIDKKDLKKMDLFIQYGLAAAVEAITDSKLEITEKNADRIGVAVGSGIGGLPFIEENHSKLEKGGPRKISPFFIPGAITNMVAGQISIRYGMKGPNIAVVTACTTGTHNIGLGARTILYGDADVMIVGGSEMATTPLGLGGFSACRALSTRNQDPQAASRPWDKARDGFVLGDGAGILVLEEYERAKQRNAPIYAELVGFGMSSDAYHMTSPAPEGQGAMAAMLNTLHDANIDKTKVGYINAHATSTPLGDELELRAIRRVFGEHTKNLAISSTKSMTGHLLGAAGAVEAIFTILALRDQKAPPTINLDNPGNPPNPDNPNSNDDDYSGLNFVPNKYQELKMEYALSNSFGFGGTNASLLFLRL
ncbi:3-oxoacyl-[acyl-carrier-protein] synthase 2 [Candidatus Rickettsiella viridis]|uniref:3-oxoacyl-[acyl-carrier-protein] synthase 2 n=1 Tax=Candidatus Rickettsiella viridis TaxID=676208 RepID=A0A2Z5UUT2_9COXI|nr:beta-ketoacyl-ACP synthase II [Candidatus Rickettsiella viridis]BBB15244.1 3-oxoacyl-[acyl-carrier-protein] synthase 2 [Candidatus Rickettsiella viridis]